MLQWLPLVGAEPDPAPGLETTVAERAAVQAALDRLPAGYRVPLVLYVYEERTVAEIGEILGLSKSAVKMRLSRAREKFRRAYGQEKDPCQ